MAANSSVSEDELRLARMGYKQEFSRSFGFIHNFGVSFSHISIIIGVGTLLSFALSCGGSAAAVWGWIFVSLMSACVALAMGEICSAYPTAGGLYYWSAKLGGDRYGPVFAWFNLCGEIGGISSVGFSVAGMIFSCVLVYNPSFDYQIWKGALVAIVVLISCGVINSINDTVIERVMEFSVALHLVGPLIIVIVCLAKAPTRQTASFVFTNLENLTGQDSQGFAILLSLLFPAWTFLGYDASAHVSEETKNSHTEAAKGIVYSVIVSAVAGFLFLIGLLFSIQSIDSILGGPPELGGPYPQAIISLFIDAAGKDVGVFLMAIIIAGSYCCGIAVITANSRMMYAFARDRGFGGPLSRFLYWSHPTTKLPLRTVWFGVAVSILVTCIGFGSSTGLNAASSVATIGLMTAYTIPTFTKLTMARNTFKRGEFHLGPFSEIIGWIAVLWVCFLFVLLCLPQFYPVTAVNFNYASVMIGAVTIFSALYWILDAHKWFKGPIIRVSEEELAAMEDNAKKLDGSLGVSAA
ncbi:amino acid/metabolite permease [Gonapodya prolifera JEL478]|uniref:Amino acid/metabolite permease n=1 Tax=Gonapodya prolifera (strain JEL478) TaxID=1344416 RepID=A0A139A237_GONPJ|nr:amino acid/metabolite permease [Gonapodya prolifera JEL478]|eukprot:KXS10804.1 amino acid/metabolite permease [Gonapodya prolifera JEL478]